MEKISISLEIERLLQFAIKHKLIKKLDVIPSRNSLLDMLKVNEPFDGAVSDEELESANDILGNILDYALQSGILVDNTVTSRDILDARIMGILMPRQSEVADNFFKLYKEQGKISATDAYYALSKASNYIRMDRISKNLYWQTSTDYGSLEITVNLSKPEKDPKEIAASRLVSPSSYPKCLLCIENVGYAGRINHPARQNHRVIPVSLGTEQWYFQYSPYVYYNEHCIVFYEKHVPMQISSKTFERLFDFVDQFPHYFIGSNADLPIVGGSILSHEHFQGGRHVFPMEEAQVEQYFHKDEFNQVRVGILKWPLSVIRLASSNRSKLIELSSEILIKWRNYSDEKLQIISHSETLGKIIPHNTITPIARKNTQGDYEIDLVLRNNRTTQQYPYGIFHPHEELHHIKKENIGLIEVMGLAVLPARLNTELREIESILQGNLNILKEERENESSIIYKHLSWIDELIKKYGTECTADGTSQIIKKEVGHKFLQVLMDAGVYKRNPEGKEGFKRFMNSLGLKVI